MKALICDMCSSNNMVKQDGLFVCQSCGTKYSVEEARRMMFDGPIEIEGSVKLDRTEEFENLAQLAREDLVDQLYEDAMNNSRDALAIFSDDVEMTAISFLARFASEGYFTELPLYCKNGIARINLLYSKLEESFDYRRTLLNRIKNYGNIVCNYKIGISRAAIEDLKSQKYEYSDKMLKDARMSILLCKSGSADERMVKARIKELERNKAHNENIQYKISKIVEMRNSIEDFQRQVLCSVDYKLKVIDREEEAYKASIRDAYWAEHSAEKFALDTELLALNKEYKEINDELIQLKRRASELDEICKLGNTPLELKKKELSSKISKINNEKDRLGFWNFIKRSKFKKEIKKLERDIPSKNDISEEQDRMKKQYQNEYKVLKKSIHELSNQRIEINSRILYVRKTLAREV